MRDYDGGIDQYCRNVAFLMFVLVLISGVMIPLNTATAQTGDVTIDLDLQPVLTSTQVLGLASLGIDESGRGANLFNLVIRNNSEATAENLYLDIQLSSTKNGLIAELYQEQGRPFSLDPFQIVVGNNNQLQDGLPGVEEPINFDGGLTEGGEEFLNGLEGSTKLPPDIYKVVVSIYQNANSRNGGTLLSTVEQTFGGNISSDTSVDLYLIQPGAEVGTDEIINTRFPVFRWEGPVNLTYRLIVVESDELQSPEALLQAAQSTESTLIDGSSGFGSLLASEHVDAEISSVSFAMPPSGVQQFEEGKTYYWQVFTIQSTVGGTVEVPSEIWKFKVADSDSQELTGLSEELQSTLEQILGSERYNQLKQQGFNFSSITLDGQTFSGGTAFQKIEELKDKLENGDITIVIN